MPFGNRKKRIKLTVNAFAPSMQADFPALVDTKQLDSVFWANVQADGGDIVLTTAADQRVAVDLSQIDTVLETMALWMDTVLISASGGEEFWLYYDGDGAETQPLRTDTHGSDNTYGPEYQGVFHTGEKVGSGLPDSTSNDSGWTEQEAPTAYNVVAPPGSAVDFSDVGWFDKASVLDWGVGQLTVEFWLKINSTNNGNYPIISVEDKNEVIQFRDTPNKVRIDTAGSSATQDTEITSGIWYHYSFRYDNDTNLAEIFFNGEPDGSDTQGAASSTNAKRFGRFGSGGAGRIDGQVAELTATDTLSSDDRIKTRYLNQVDTDNMWTASTSESVAKVTPLIDTSLTSGLIINGNLIS